MADFGQFDARRILEDYWGLEAEIEPLPSEYDRNFRVETGGGERFVLKVMRAGYGPELVDLQCKALDHIARRVPDVSLPRVQSTRGGRSGPSVPASQDSQRL